MHRWDALSRALGIVAMVLALTGPAAADPATQLWTERIGGEALDPDAPVSMSAFSRLAKQLSPAVVNVHTTRSDPRAGLRFTARARPTGLGTGFIIHRDGYILTNHHVIDGSSEITVRLANESVYTAQVVGTFAQLDVALLKITANEPLTVAPLGDSGVLEVGEWVIAIGNPFGLSHTVTAGIVSGKGRRDLTTRGEPTYARFIQTDASINLGNSGGPLINIRGEVVGINTAISAAGQGIGFAVPVNMVKTILPQLATGRVRRSYLGVRIGPVDRRLAEARGLDKPHGALVAAVMPGTPAAGAGIRKGDIVTRFRGQPIEHADDLPWLASTSGREQEVPLTINRSGERHQLKIKLAPYPEDVAAAPGRPGTPGATEVDDVGLSVRARSNDSTVRDGGGVVVKSVAKDSPAAALGIRVGDVITQVNYAPVHTVEAFTEAVASVPAGEILSFTIRRDRRDLFKAYTR